MSVMFLDNTLSPLLGFIHGLLKLHLHHVVPGLRQGKIPECFLMVFTYNECINPATFPSSTWATAM